ncbi:MAG: acetylglutamate kinase [Phycisphaerales bacterium]
MLREIVLNLLHNLGGRAEVARYLREHAQGSFVLVKVGGGIIEDDLEELASALVFIHHVGMHPVVVHGAGPQLTRELESAGIDSDWIDGLRVTDDATLAAAHRVFQRTGATLADAIERRGVSARPLPSGIFQAVRSERTDLGLVGRIDQVDTSPVCQARGAGQIPVLSPMASTSGGQLLNVNADEAARAMAAELDAKKVIYLTPTGGILDERGHVIPAVDSAQDLDRMTLDGVITGGMAKKLREIDSLLRTLDDTATVSITRPEKVAKELFTHLGSGTLVRRGSPIQKHAGINELDRQRVIDLLERSFGRALDPAFLDTVDNTDVYLGGDYNALAIVREREHGSYLDKIAISERAQGVGLGGSMWSRIRDDHPKLYWRSRWKNDANNWYLPKSDGMRRTPNWIVFWSGFEQDEEIRAITTDALSFPHAFNTVREEAHIGS